MIHIPLYTIRHRQIGGTEFAIYNLLRGLALSGADVRATCGREADLAAEFLGWARSYDNLELVEAGGLPGPKGVRFLEEALYDFRRRGDDWALYPNYFCPTTPGKKGPRAVLVHDIQYKRYPEYHSAKRRAWLDLSLSHSFRKADRVLVISRSELALIEEYFGPAAAARCAVIHNAIDWQRFDADASAAGGAAAASNYILSVCHQFPHKNVRTLLMAFAEVAERDRDVELHLVGAASPDNLAFIHSGLPESVRARVHITGFVSDARLAALYRHARLFVLPSLYEGFGMPAVEALGFGIPTLVSRAYSLPEVTLGYADYVDDPLDHHEWAERISHQLNHEMRPTVDQVEKIRLTYDPKTVAHSLLEVLRQSNG